MDFVKKWWIWILMGVVMLATFLVNLIAVSRHEHAAAQQGSSLKQKVDEIENTERSLASGEGAVPTRKDIQICSEHVKGIKAEGLATVKTWNEVSRSLQESHSRADERGFAFFLNSEDRKLGQRLAMDLGSTMRVGESDQFVPKWITTIRDYNLIATNTNFQSLAETKPVWTRFLIKKTLHRIIGKTTVSIRIPQAVDAGDGGVTEQMTDKRFTVEQLSNISIGEVIPATHTVNGERKTTGNESMFGGAPAAETTEDIVYYDRYPLSFNVVAHPAVIDQLMKNMLDAPRFGMLAVAKQVRLRPYSFQETQPSGATVSVGGMADVIPDKVEVFRALTHFNEPPISADFTYEIYHFDIKTKSEQDAAAESQG